MYVVYLHRYICTSRTMNKTMQHISVFISLALIRRSGLRVVYRSEGKQLNVE